MNGGNDLMDAKWARLESLLPASNGTLAAGGGTAGKCGLWSRCVAVWSGVRTSVPPPS